jgi:hypothetical protein
MANVLTAEPLNKSLEGSNVSAVSWAAVLAGGVAIGGLSLVLLAFGAGMGFSSVSPWSNSGVSSGTFEIATGIYLVVVAMLSSTIGGYIAGRLRTRWTGLHSEEVLFRDTAHGFLAWAFAAVLGAAILGAAATYVVGGAPTGAVQGAAQTTDYFVDMLLRPGPNGRATVPTQDAAATRREVGIILARALPGGDLPAGDRAYLTQLVAARSGVSPEDADRRITDVISQAKAAADSARKAAAALSMWLTVSMLVGAFSASLAAIEGGQLRDGRWKGVIGGKAYLRERSN